MLLPKLDVAGSNPVSRSMFSVTSGHCSLSEIKKPLC
jgi:hypothetical protein